MVELKGSLGTLGLPAIVQLIGELHHSGNLELTRHDARAMLGFNDGRLVAASYGDQRGPRALAGCCLELADADFLFVEGAPADEPTMDLGGSELQTQIRGLMNGEITVESLESRASTVEDTVSLEICPLLGFVDDETRHYSRPTAMHRCFSARAPSLVTAQMQRDLCLSGRYPTCPRYRNAPAATTVTPASPTPTASSPPDVPTGVAARMARSAETRMAPPDLAGIGSDSVGRNHAEPSVDGLLDAPAPGRFRRRGVVLVAIGAGLGLLVLAAVFLFARPSLNGALAQRPATSAASTTSVASAASTASATSAAPPVAQTVPPAPTPARVAAAVASPASVPTTAPTAVLATRPATPTARLAPTAPAAGQPLMDVRFASGPKPGWLDNPPYAAWSDGAYRLQARQPLQFVAVGVQTDRPLGDVVASATFRKTGGPPGGGYGLVVRDQSPSRLDGVNQDASFYVLEAGDLGDIGIWRRDGDHWVDLVPWQHSDAVRVGGSPNDLVARAIGDRLTFIVNQTEAASVQDSTLVAGGVGVFVGGDYNEVALDRFQVQVPD